MHKKYSRMATLLVASVFAGNAGAIEKNKPDIPAKPTDFAYAVPLQFEGQDALYQTTLPLSVYQNTVRSDLGDMRVFNAQGEVVPHRLQQAEHSSLEKSALIKLAYFPLQGPANTGLDQLSIRIKRNAAGSLIDIHNNACMDCL